MGTGSGHQGASCLVMGPCAAERHRAVGSMSRGRMCSAAGYRIGILAVLASILLASCGDRSNSTRSSIGSTSSSAPAAVSDTRVPPPAVTVSDGITSLEGVVVRTNRVGALSGASALAARKGYPNLYVAERSGRIRQVTVNHQLDNNGNVRKTDYLIERSPLLDISRQLRTGEELGLLGLAFSSDGRQLYLSYTPTDGGLRVDEYTMDDDRVDTRSRRTILEIDHRADSAVGGSIAIGPDGFLYVATGDPSGGPAQDPRSLLGKVLRIDPQSGGDDQPYGIPDSNPFRDGAAGAPEVWLSGLRDPGSIAFDTRSGDMWLTDHGETIEEINVLRATGGPGTAGRGANLGWGRIEGAHGARTAAPDGHTAPLFEYNRDRGECPVVGGILYRGKAVPGLTGAYVFGDRCGGELRGLLAGTGVILDQRELGVGTGGALAAIAAGPDGEIWLLGAAGELYRVEPGP